MNFFSQAVVLNTEFGVQQKMKEWFDKEMLAGEKVNIELCPLEFTVYTYK